MLEISVKDDMVDAAHPILDCLHCFLPHTGWFPALNEDAMSILHDWGDEDCIKILKHCKAAIPNKDNGGKIIIIDMVVGATTDNEVNAVETQLLGDLLMLVASKGKERTESEWRNIIVAAGFADYKITPLTSLRSVIEVYP
ncbi:putative trans-resveratrol di-O-methyltransferase [Dioscorea sansibarensis]